MKRRFFVAICTIVLIALGMALTWEAPATLAFGWYSFLGRVVPRMTVYWPSVAVAAVALAGFTAGLHWFAASYAGHSSIERGKFARGWRLRWTGAAVAIIVIAFAAGISVIGMVHQIAWLAASEQPLLGERLVGDRHAPEQQLKSIYLGVSAIESVTGRLPSGARHPSEGAAPQSWELQILPFLSYVTNEIDRMRPWNDSANAKYFKSVIPEFINPEFRTPQLTDDDGYGVDHYSGNSHVMVDGNGMQLDEIQDGQAQTLLLGEVNDNFSPWGRPLNVRDPAHGINRGANGFGGPENRHGAMFLMVDGSSRVISEDVDPEVLRALSTPAGEEASKGTP